MDCSVTVENFHAICRICLAPKNNMNTFISPIITYMLESCTSIQNSEIPNKKMPQQICTDCYGQLQNAFHFKQQYLLSTQILTEIILQSEKVASENCDKDEKNIVIQDVQKQVNNIDNDNNEDDSKRKISDENTTNELNIKEEVENEDVSNVFNAEIKSDSSTVSDDDCDNDNDYVEKENYTIQELFQRIEKTQFRDKCGISTGGRVCYICGKTFRGEFLRRHMRRHSNNRPLFECDICHKKFKIKASISTHKQLYHSSVNDARGLCSICGKFVVSSLEEHEITHTEISDRDQFKCDKCDKVYLRKKSLREHIRLRHSIESRKTYSCKICNKVLSMKNTFDRHMKLVHSNLRQHVCLYCKKCFKTKSNLNTHIRGVHLNERPYSCTICAKDFHNQPTLTNHMRTHTGERPFSCQICKKSFSFRAALTTHMKQHSK